MEQIKPIGNNISFGYKSVLKTLWRNGELPTVTHGLYGGLLTQENVTLEHLKPKSLKGKSILSNYALATGGNNMQRGSRPLKYVLTPESALAYFKQFEGIKRPNFNGDEYIKQVSETIKRLDVKI